jgi:hypothetical protein
MALRECETFFLGTARSIEGKRSDSTSSNDGTATVQALGARGSKRPTPAILENEENNERVGASASAAMSVSGAG